MKYFNILIFIVICLTSCKKDDPYSSFEDIKAEKVTPWIRYEQLLNQVDTNRVVEALDELAQKYPDFTTIYFLRVINDSYNPDTSFANIYNMYRKSPLIRIVSDTLPVMFKDLSQEERDFSDAFARLHKLLPEVKQPRVFTCLTEFGVGAFSTSDMEMGLSLEMYLGTGNKYYNVETWPKFVQRSMNRDNMVPNLLKNFIRNTLMPAEEPRTLLDHMIKQGKEVYILKHMIPATRDTLIYDYSEAQLEFCQQNEKQIWSFFLAEKLIYSDQYKKIQKYVFPAPNSPGMPAEAPGRSSAYIGGKIIEAYMERHKEMDLKKLLANNNSQAILEEARYKP